MPFRKKIYDLGGFAKDVVELLSRLDEVRSIQSGAAIDPAFREEIMVAVARANDCRYCIFAHETAAREAGVSEDVLVDLAASGTGGATLGAPTVVALEYARALAAADFGPVDPALEAEVVALHGDDGRRTVETTARVMTLMNLTGNTVDALLSRLGGDPAHDSRPCDEVALTSLWVLGALLTSVNLMRARGESPVSLLASFRTFASELQHA